MGCFLNTNAVQPLGTGGKQDTSLKSIKICNNPPQYVVDVMKTMDSQQQQNIKVMERLELLEQKNESLERQIQRRFREQEQLTNKLSAKLEEMENRRKFIENRQQFNKVSYSKSPQQVPIVSPISQYLQEFMIDGQKIERANFDGNFYQLVGNIPISHKPINQFKIVKTQYKRIMMGIVDSKYIEDQSSITQQRLQCICYSVYNGNVITSGKETGISGNNGANQGETIAMMVKGQKIKWRVDGKTRAKQTTPMITDPSIKWVPFIVMWNKGDIIEWE